MTAESNISRLDLPALDGANPLGFLAALGTLVTLREAGETDVRIGWSRRFTWIASLEGFSQAYPEAICTTIAKRLRGLTVSPSAEDARNCAQGEFDRAKKAVEDKKREVRTYHLSRKEREMAHEAEVRPLEEERDSKRSKWLQTLLDAVPRPELAIGKHIDCSPSEYREHAGSLLMNASMADREAADLLAAFASDGCVDKYGRVEATPFCFVTGSGHQYFLDTVRQLMQQVTQDRVRETLFEPWKYEDERLSLRWDPIEDRRYALTDRDPSGEAARTVWMANLLAYRSLVLFPSAPTSRGLGTAGWDRGDGKSTFTWPIWDGFLGIDEIRSLLQSHEVYSSDHASLEARGICGVYRVRKIRVGEGGKAKFNFSAPYGV